MDDTGDWLIRSSFNSRTISPLSRWVPTCTFREPTCAGVLSPRILSSKSSGDRAGAMVARGRSSDVPAEGDGSIRVVGGKTPDRSLHGQEEGR